MISLILYLLVRVTAVQPAEPRPVFTPESFTIDFDSIPYGGPGKRELYFTNTGDAPLMLDVRSSCGCLVPEWPKDPIPPGGRNKIGAHYDTNREGPFNKTLTVRTNEPEPGNIYVIRVKGYVRPNPRREVFLPVK